MAHNLNTVYLGLGSNIGNRQEHLNRALGYLAQRMRVVQKSSVYETEPVGQTHQARFLNMVCEARTSLAPKVLLTLVKGIEKKLGRPSHYPKDSPRIIDIDILFYGDQIISEPDLIVPHPRLSKRAFVLIPLRDIAPDFIDPSTGCTISLLLEKIRNENQGVIKLEGY